MRYGSSKAAAASPVYSTHASRSQSSSGLHHKKDGTLDMRYGSSKAAVASPTYSTHANRPPSSSGLHHKKDGTLDMRHGSSKAAAATSTHANQPSNSSGFHYKKDGTLDMRYGSSKYSDHGIPSNVPITKTGIPDMRTTAAKQWVREQAQSGMEDIPSWIPKTKDGSPDTSKAITQEYFKWKNGPSTNYVPDQRLAYYYQKLEDLLFRNCVENARNDPVEMPEYEMLPETSEIERQLSSRPMRCSNRQYDDEDS